MDVGNLLIGLGAVVAFVLALALSIALHEVGHMLPAKKFGVKVTQYMIGFGPTVWSRRRGETEYGLKGIPLGGYIRMIGMFPPKPGADPLKLKKTSTGRWETMAEQARAASFEEITPEESHRTFYRLPVRKKLVIMLGGPVMNLVIAIVLFAVVLVGFGVAGPTTTVSEVSECVVAVEQTADGQVAPTECTADDPIAPANEAGVLPGDRVVAFDGREVDEWNVVQQRVRELAGQTVPLVVERQGEELTLQVTPLATSRPLIDADGQVVVNQDGSIPQTEVGFLGLATTQDLVRQPVTEVPGLIGEGISQTAQAFVRLPQKLSGVFEAAFGGGERDPEGPISIVGAGRITSEIATYEDPAGIFGLEEKVATFLSLMASLNLFLFMFNLVPLLPLDGGHVAGALWEGTKRIAAKAFKRPDPGYVDVAKAMPLTYAVSLTFMALALVLIYADLVNPVRLFG